MGLGRGLIGENCVTWKDLWHGGLALDVEPPLQLQLWACI
jgi:hypothetical protein